MEIRNERMVVRGAAGTKCHTTISMTASEEAVQVQGIALLLVVRCRVGEVLRFVKCIKSSHLLIGYTPEFTSNTLEEVLIM